MISTGGSGRCQLLLFGDLTTPFEHDLTQLLHHKSNASLQRFLAAAAAALRHEFSGLDTAQRAWLPPFTDLFDLTERLHGHIGSPALRSALLCVHQVGRFILADAYPHAAECVVMGVCTGSFAAAAVASSRSVQDLILAGVEAVLVAFRAAWHSLQTRRDIDTASGAVQAPWSTVVALSESQALDLLAKFNDELKTAPASRPYLSAVSPSTVTISGPPQSLQRLVDASALKARPIPIETPYHASHLHYLAEVDGVLGRLHDDRLEAYTIQVPLLSVADGESLRATSLSVALKRAVEDTLCRQVRWDRTCTAVVTSLATRDSLRSCVILPVASNAATLLSSALHGSKGIEVTISDALNTSLAAEGLAAESGAFADAKIAIVGYSGRYPEAASNDELWEVLMASRDCHRTIPLDRFDWEAHYDATGKKKNHTRVRHGCFINAPGHFDARFFNMSRREAENTDPAQRLAIMAAYEAMEMGGIVPDRTAATQRDRVGVYFGTTSDDWREVNSGQDVDTYFIPGGNRAFVPGRISYFFRFSGPSISVDTACSSSFAAIATACNALWQGDCDTALAGGTNVLTNPDNFVGLDRGHFLSTTGNCNPFDDAATGYCRADAVGAVVLKRLDDALRDRDPICGVIAGAGTNHCGQTVSITRPHEGDQLALFRRILRHSTVRPADVGYVEMHGTGTQAGDAAEMRSVLAAFTPGASVPRPLPLYLGAVKANVGHAESASGVTALIKVLMMMRHDQIPPQRVDGVLNRNYPTDLAQRNVHIPLRPAEWPRTPGTLRRAFLNNFSAAGGNTALLLEDAPLSPLSAVAPAAGDGDPRTLHPIVVSGKTASAARANARALATFLHRHPDTSLSALSYTTTARRTQYRHRLLVPAADVAHAADALQRTAESLLVVVPAEPPRVAFVFAGQGSLYAGLGQQLFRQLPAFRRDLEHFDRVARRHGFPSFLPVVTGEAPIDARGGDDPVVTQLALVCVQMALYRLWSLWLGSPCAVTGHSLGEYAALHAAGVLSAADAIFLVGSRARLLAERCTSATHTMLALKTSLSSVEALLPPHCEVACINSPTDVVAAGPQDQIDSLAQAVKSSLGVTAVPLDVSFAFHSAQVDPILPEFQALAETVQYRAPSVPYLSPLLAQAVTEPGVLTASYLTRAARHRVNFQGALEAARDAHVVSDSTVWIEFGPHPACSGMIKRTIALQALTAPTLRKDTDAWKVVVAALDTAYRAGVDVDWNAYHRGFDAGHIVLPLPAYQWDLQNYWIDYRHNFCLTKGDDPSTFAPPRSVTPPVPAPALSLSSSVHRVLEKEQTAQGATMLTETDLHDPRLLPVIAGHKVNGAMLCPSSLYADMSLTIANHMVESRGRADDQYGLDCRNMSIKKPLIARVESSDTLLRTAATVDWTRSEVTVSFFSVTRQGRKIADHASCTVRITPKPTWLKDWQRNAYLITTRIAALHDGVEAGTASRLNRGMAYCLFARLVDYSREYQGMDQVILDSASLEATARVKFQVDSRGFDWNPCWIDSLGHIAGFIMNGNDNDYSPDQVFVNHGWEGMRCAKPIVAGKTYTTYNRMQLESGTLYSGDTYILDAGEVIAIFERVKFQGVHRSVLNNLLPPPPTNAVKKRLAPEAEAVSARIPDEVLTAEPDLEFSTTPSRAASTSPSDTSDRSHDGSSTGASSVEDDVPPTTDVMAIIRKVLSEETGASDDDILQGSSSLAELGIDSLLALTLHGTLSEQLDVPLPPNLFVEHETLGDVETALVGAGVIRKPSTTPAPSQATGNEGSSPSTSGQNRPALSHGLASSAPHATSVLLQGSPKTADKLLFFFPDGAGSATTYQFIPNISPHVAVFGLNCPWMKQPQDLSCSLEQYVAKFLIEVRRRQPQGPYRLGGASAGGILAYEAAQQLTDAGETVETLVFLDAPDPIGLENPNERLYDFLQEMGMFGMVTSKDLSWLRPHFAAFLKMLDRYEVKEFVGPSPPATHIIYARDGMCKDEDAPRPELRADDPREMLWLLNNRTDFSGAGWNSLLGKENVFTTPLSDVNHYTIMREGPKMEDVRSLIARALKV